MKQVIIAVLVIGAIIGGAVVFGKDKDAGSGTPSSNIYGDEASTVTLVEYGDFECPACAAFHPLVSQIKEEYKDKIKFEFRHFPLATIHFNALAAHRASQAAANQGKFWEMHDLLYERQASWRADAQQTHGGTVASNNTPGPVFEGYAEELGLDIEKFKADVAVSETIGTINADVDLGKADGVTGTPSFILNGTKIDDSSTIDTLDEFRAVLDAEIEKANGAESANTTSDESADSTPTEDASEDSESENAPEETDSEN